LKQAKTAFQEKRFKGGALFMRRMRLPGFSLFCAFSDRLFTRMRMRAAVC